MGSILCSPHLVFSSWIWKCKTSDYLDTHQVLYPDYMPLPGGPADKLGNRYELWWTISQLQRMLHRPLTLRGPSTRGVSRPTGETSGVSCVVCMFALPRVKLDCHRHVQCVCKAALGQFDLEPILALRFGVTHVRFRRLAKVGCVAGLTDQRGLGLGRPPRFGAHAAKGNAGFRHIPA